MAGDGLLPLRQAGAQQQRLGNQHDDGGEDEQYEILQQIVRRLEARPVTIRTLDVGGEKLASALGDRFAPGPNPALGLRAIRLSLKEPTLLETQLAAIEGLLLRGERR